MLKKSFSSLSSSNIDQASELVIDFLSKQKLAQESIVKVRLSVEDTLVLLQSHCGEDTPFMITTKKYLAHPEVVITYCGKQYNPLDDAQASMLLADGLMPNLSAQCGLSPTYAYRRARNTLTYELPRQHLSSLQRIGLGFVLALIVGISFRLFLPSEVGHTIAKQVLKPIESIFLGLLGSIALPLMFFSTLSGIISVGDRDFLGQIGGRLLKQFVGHLALFAILVMAGGLLLMNIDIVSEAGGSGGSADIANIFQKFFPKNLIQSFYNGESLHIVLLAVAMGFGILIHASKMNNLGTMFVELKDLFMALMSWVGQLIPLFIFALIARLIIEDTLFMLYGAWKSLLLFTLSLFFICGVQALALSHRLGISFVDVLRGQKKVFTIGSTTMSTMASIATMIEEAIKQFGVRRSLSELAFPLSAVLARYNTISSQICYTFFLAEAYHVGMSWTVIAMLVPIFIMMAIATPSVAGGGLAVVSIIFLFVGIPAEAVGMVAILAIFTDFMTGFGVLATNMEVLLLADKLKMMEQKETCVDSGRATR